MDPHFSHSTDDLISFLHSKLEVFDNMRSVSMVEAAFEPVLKQSPNITNINEIYQDETSTLSIASRSHLNFNVSNNVISEEPEDELEYDNHNNNNLGDAHSSSQPTLNTPEPLEILTIPTNLSDDSSSMILKTAIIDPRVKTIAKEIYHQTYNDVKPDKYTAFLGTAKQFNISICQEFMRLYHPWPKSLLDALRKLCSKLHLTGESVQIDQVLEMFAQSWCQSNPANDIGDYKAVHILCFAIIILNSDLHNEQNLESKFTKEEFIANTWDALIENKSVKSTSRSKIEPVLKSLYDSIASQQLELLQVSEPAQKVKKKTSMRKFSTSSARSTTSRYDTLTNISVRSNRNSRRLSSIGSTISLSLTRETTRVDDSQELNYQVDYPKDKYDDKLETLGPPWMIEGLLKSESSTTTSNKFKKSNWFSRLTNTNIISSELDIYNVTDWKQSIVIIQKGLLKQYAFGSVSDRKNFSKTKSDKFVNTVLTYNLYSATASLIDDQIISNSQKKTNGVAWVLTVPNLLSNDYNEDKKIVYYAPSLEVANNFIDTCNFWAARITSIPSTEDKIVTNAEFGWSERILSTADPAALANIKLTRWECLLSIESSFIPSAYELQDQFDQLASYVDYLEQSIAEHNELQPVLKYVWGRAESLKSKYDLVMTSWSEKYAHLYRQHQKYKIYLDSLALAIAFRASKI